MEELRKVLVEKLKLDEDTRLEAIPSGKFNDSFFITGKGRELVVRVAPPRDAVFLFYERDMMRQEPGIHQVLRENTSVPVAEILLYDDSLQGIPRDYLVMERLPGRPISELPNVPTDRVLAQVGESLAQAHGIVAEPGRYGYLGEHAPMKPQPTWTEAFVVMWRKLIDDIVGVGHYSRDEADRMLALLDKHLHLFTRETPASLLHMDVWGQNILADEKGALTGLIDWDRALWGDPEIEFAVLDYCGISQAAFWEGYGARRENDYAAKIRNTFYLLYELQKYIVIAQGRGHDSARARSYKEQSLRMVRAYLD